MKGLLRVCEEALLNFVVLFRRINLRLYDEQMYLFILLALSGLLVKARICRGASLVGDS